MWTKSGLFPNEYDNVNNSVDWSVVFTNDALDAVVKKVEITGYFDSAWTHICATLHESFDEKKHRQHFETTLFIRDFSFLTQYNIVNVSTDNPDIIAHALFKLHDLQPDLICPLIEICPAIGVKFNHTQASLPQWFKQGQGSSYVSTKLDPVIKNIEHVFLKDGSAEVRFDFSKQSVHNQAFKAILNNPALNSLEKNSIPAITVKLKSKEQLPLLEILITQLESFEPHLKYFHDHLIWMLEQPWPAQEPASVSLAASFLSMLRLGSSTPPSMDVTDPSFTTSKVSSVSLSVIK